jgi:hypothetical protein
MGLRLPKHVFPVSRAQSRYVWGYPSKTSFCGFWYPTSFRMRVRLPKQVFPVSSTQSCYVCALGFQNTFFRFPVPDLITFGG